MGKKVVVLINMGGPDSLLSVKPFLKSLFSDRDIFRLPCCNKIFATIISWLRAPKVEKQYSLIGGSSPIGKWTLLQKELLQKQLPDFEVLYAMRYTMPFLGGTAKHLSSEDYDKIILLPLYPQFSFSTTLSAVNEWNRNYSGKAEVSMIDNFCDNHIYIEAVNKRIDEALNKIQDANKTILLFSAHGIPVSFIKRGDPYNKQINTTVSTIMKHRNHSHEYFLSYQSKVGPVKWLEPSTPAMIQSLARGGIKNIVIIPVSFVSDHIETLYEINFEYRHIATTFGIKNFIITEGLNDSPLFIKALTDLVNKKND